MPAYFVTGTDTGVGKTVVAASLLAAARARGLRTAALKPVETGCGADETGGLRPADAAILAEAARTPEPPTPTCVYAFRAPAAPAVAARWEDRTVDIAAIASALAAHQAANPDLLIVEGAGGLLVPFTATHSAADISLHLDLPLLLVARAGLGTINHTLLTLECARLRGLDVRGLIFSAADETPDDPTTLSNRDEIATRTDIPILGTLPKLTTTALPDLAHSAEAHLDLDALLLR